MKIQEYKRIVIVGNNGSGKSYLATKLSTITGLPLIHLDSEFWKPDWEQPTREEWSRRQRELTSMPEWIIDGTHMSTLDIRFQKADLIIFINVNRWICMMSVLMRYKTKRTDIPDYLEEKIDIQFFRFIKGLLDFPK